MWKTRTEYFPVCLLHIYVLNYLRNDAWSGTGVDNGFHIEMKFAMMLRDDGDTCVVSADTRN